MVDAAYRKPRVAAAVSAIRSADDDGATRKIGSRPLACAAASHGPASSTIRSGVITPEPPAAARSRAKASTPYASIGLK